jgi:peptide/nickel transport system ATP-binding protein
VAAPVLEIRDLSVELSIGGRWIQALDRVGLSIERGEVLGLVGESGSGKSLTALSVALVFQNPTSYLNPVLRIGDQIAEVFDLNPELLEAKGTRERRREAWRRSVEALRLVRIPDPERVVTRYPFELSGGMQQRVVIAMALVRQPDLVIADEITTALDVTVQAQILSLLAELRRTVRLTLLLITHDLGIVAQLADRVVVMYSGSVAEASDVRTLFRAPRHPYSKALLETVPTIDGGRTVFRPIRGAMPALTDPPPGCRFHPRCPDAFDECSRRKPERLALAAGHAVACHKYGDAGGE